MKERGSYLSRGERDRRYAALRQIATQADCGAVIVVGPAQVGGKRYFRYFTDWNIQSFGGFLLVGTAGGENVVLKAWSQAFWSRLVDWVQDIEAHRDPATRTLELLARSSVDRVGFVGLDHLSVREARVFGEALEHRMVDLTHPVDLLMARKSPEELALVASSASIFDAAWRTLLATVRPGLTEWQVASIAGAALLERGVSSSIILIGATSDSFGAACVGWPRDRKIGDGDLVQMSIEGPGPSGYCVEIGGTFAFRRFTSEERAQLDAQLEGMESGVAQLVAGRRSGDVARAVEDVFRRTGYKTGYRGMHGIGLGIPEPPTIDLGDGTLLERGNVIAMHPNAVNAADRGTLLSRTYVVGPDRPEPLSQIPLEFPEL